jgi:hypothetical protein
MFEKYSADPDIFIDGLTGEKIATWKLEFFRTVEI